MPDEDLAALQRMATAQGDLIPDPADEVVTLKSEAAEDVLFAKVAAEPSRKTPAAGSFQGKEGDGRVTDPVALSQEKARVRRALEARPSDATKAKAEPPAGMSNRTRRAASASACRRRSACSTAS